METPEVGSTWTSQGFIIEVIDKNDTRNIDVDGTYKRSGEVIYQYLTITKKIGHCKTLEGFYASWHLDDTN